MDRFAHATALHGGPDRFVGAIEPGWDILDSANGGYLMAILGRGAIRSSKRPDVVTLSAEFSSPGRVGPVEVTTTTLKAGRRFATTRVDLHRDERLVVSGTVITGDLTSAAGPSLVLADRPIIPGPEVCLRAEPTETFPPPFVGQVDMRIHPDDALTAESPTTATVRGWFRLLDDEPMDTLAVVQASDAFPPTIFNTDLDLGWVPTVQMTVHLRRRPNGSWLQMHMTTTFITNGMFEADALLWDESGALVAQSRQLALAPQPS